MAQYKGAVIGLGWMGMLYDLAPRIMDRFDVDDVDRPTPPLDVHRRWHHHQHPGEEGLPAGFVEALIDRPEIDLVAVAERDPKRIEVYKERHGIGSTYTNAEEMLRREKPDIVSIATNCKGRADLICLAVECGAKGIFTEKPMTHTLEEADRVVRTCAEAGVPLAVGAITTSHPSFGKAKQLVNDGVIGELVSIETESPHSQQQEWSYFLEQTPSWVIGANDPPMRESGTDEFAGQGLMATEEGLMVHFRRRAPAVRLTGKDGELVFTVADGWKLWKDVETPDGVQRVQLPDPQPKFFYPWTGAYLLADVMDCVEGMLDEPKISGRRVHIALEIELAMKQSSARGGVRVDLPLKDRSVGLNYDWFR